MSKFATKAAANMFCQARYEAAKSNERLSSREGAAEEIGIDRTRLARIELGSTIPYQEGKEYQNLAMRTNDHKNSDRIIKKINNNQLVNSDELIIPDIGGVLNGCLGLAGESGEVLDLIKKWVFHENELHVEHLKKELGDVMWYVAMICESMELDIDEIFQMNINKLKVRYPEGFDPDKANHRRADDI